MITITGTEEAKFYFEGTQQEVPEIIARLEFAAPMDGKTIQVALYPYGTIEDYDAKESIIRVRGADEIVGVKAVAEVVAVEASEGVEAVEAVAEVIGVDPVKGFTIQAQYYDLANDTDPVTYKDQTIQVAHDEVKEWLEALGYVVVISGI